MEASFTPRGEHRQAVLMSTPDPANSSAVPPVAFDDRGLRLLFPRLGRSSSSSGDVESNNVANARRCLFRGPRPSRDEVDALIDEELAHGREEAKRKWNFDFEKLEPLPGRYAWEPVFTVDLGVEGSRTDTYDDPVVFGDVGEVFRGRQRTTSRRRHVVVDESVITPTVGGSVPPSRAGVDDERASNNLSITSERDFVAGASGSNNSGVNQSDVSSSSETSRQPRITGKNF
jgi:hypothetical protein